MPLFWKKRTAMTLTKDKREISKKSPGSRCANDVTLWGRIYLLLEETQVPKKKKKKSKRLMKCWVSERCHMQRDGTKCCREGDWHPNLWFCQWSGCGSTRWLTHSHMMGNFSCRLLLHEAERQDGAERAEQGVKSSKVSSLALFATVTEQLLLYLPNYCWTFLLCLLIIWVSGAALQPQTPSNRKGRLIVQELKFLTDKPRVYLYVYVIFQHIFFIIHRQPFMTANQD